MRPETDSGTCPLQSEIQEQGDGAGKEEGKKQAFPKASVHTRGTSITSGGKQVIKN